MHTLPFCVALSFALCSSAVSAPAQESKAILDAPVVVSSYYRMGTLLDLNGDGFQDAMGWWWNSATSQSIYLRSLMNDQHGAFSLQGYASLTPGLGSQPVGSVSIRKCDINHDGLDDFSVLFNVNPGYGTTSLSVFRSTGTGAPVLVPTYSVSGGTERIGAVVTDFDGDGTTDLAVAVANQLLIYSFAPVAGSDPVATLRATLALPAQTDELIMIDGNGDATPDLYANMGNTGWIIPIVNFQPTGVVVVPHGIAPMPMSTAGDIDGDGDQDLVIFGMTDYSVVRRTGPATWNTEAWAVGGPATMLCDIDNDGDLDGLCCGGGGRSIPVNFRPSTFRVSLNDGQGQFAPAFEMPGLGSDHMAGAADVDHDGDVDLVAGRCVYYAHGPITEPIMPTLVTPDKDRAMVADIDRDGDPDFRFTYGSVRRNLGSGDSDTFTPLCQAAPNGTTNSGPGWSGDFDGDGDVDLLVRRYAGPTLIGTWLYTNNGGGGFIDGGQAGPTGSDFAHGYPGMTPDRCKVVDIDNDGDLDLLVSNSGPPSGTTIHKNDGTGHFFDVPIQVPGCFTAAVADLNGDGILDLVNYYPMPNIFWGSSGGTYASAASFAATNGVYGLEGLDVGDLDGDGDIDIAIAAAGSNFGRNTDVYWNDGSGNFTREEIPNTPLDYYPSARAINAVDLNGDGRLDLVSGPVFSAWSAAYVILRRADNSGWEAPIQQTLYTDDSLFRAIVHKATVVDVDSDGDLDLVTDRVIRNAQRTGLAHGKRVQLTDATAGSGGMQPTLGASGHFEVGGTSTLRLTGACGAAHGALSVAWLGSEEPTFGRTSGPTDHLTRLTSILPILTSGSASIDGSGVWSLTYQVPAYMAGRTCVYRASIVDPASSTGIAYSNTLYVTYGL